jgi:SAM-dependent methyltransferase
MSAAPDGSPVELYARLPERGEGELVGRAVPAGGSILEVGCGTGRITRQLAARGYRVTAVDESPEMLAHVTGAETVEARIEELDLGRQFDAALLASNLVNTESAELRRAFLRSCARHADLVLIERLPPQWEPSSERTRIGDVESWLEEVLRDGDVVRAVACYAADDRRWRHPFAMRVLDDDALEAALAEAGLRLDRFLDERGLWVAATRARASFRE